MTALDIVAAGVIAFFAFSGFRKGLIAEIMKLVGVILGLVLGLHFMEPVGRIIHGFIPLQPAAENALGFLGVLVATIIVTLMISNRVRSVAKMAMLGWLDRSGGIVFGGLKGALIISAVLPLLLILPDKITFVKDSRDHSLTFKYLNGFAPKVYDSIARVIPGSKSFATQLQDSFPSLGSMGSMFGGENVNAVKQLQNFMGSEESATLKNLQEKMKDVEGMESLEDLDMGSMTPEQARKILENATGD